MFYNCLVVAFMIPKTLKSPVLCVIDRALTGIKHFLYITHSYEASNKENTSSDYDLF